MDSATGVECGPPVELSWTPNQISKTIYWQLLLKRGRSLPANGRIPSLTARAQAAADPKRLATYRRLINAPNNGSLPLLFPHVMMGSAHLEMMAHPEFPLSATGMLHLRNHVVRFAEIPETTVLDLECRLARQRIVEKGIELDIESRASIGGELVWQSISTLFKRGRFGSANEESELATLFPKLDDAAESADFEVPPTIGKQYAAVSGDRNPIHTSNLMAKLFGFKRAIAHGMWTSARTLSALPSEVPDVSRFDVSFKGPVFVGSQVSIRGEPSRFDVYCGSNPRPVICGCLSSNVEKLS